MFTYNGGSFTFEVLDLIVNEQSAFVPLQARLGATATPEPATMILLGTGLAGIGASVRKRRSAKRDAA